MAESLVGFLYIGSLIVCSCMFWCCFVVDSGLGFDSGLSDRVY